MKLKITVICLSLLLIFITSCKTIDKRTPRQKELAKIEKTINLIKEDDSFNFLDLNEFTPGKPLKIEAVHTDGTKDVIIANHTYNQGQIDWYNEGSALNLIKKQNA